MNLGVAGSLLLSIPNWIYKNLIKCINLLCLTFITNIVIFLLGFVVIKSSRLSSPLFSITVIISKWWRVLIDLKFLRWKLLFLLLLILWYNEMRALGYAIFPSCFICIEWLQAWRFKRLSYKLRCLHICLLVALTIFFTWSWYHWMSSFNCLVSYLSLLSEVLSPLVAWTHESIHKLKVLFLINLIEFVNEYWFHDTLIELLPIIFDGSFLLTLRCNRIGSNGIDRHQQNNLPLHIWMQKWLVNRS